MDELATIRAAQDGDPAAMEAMLAKYEPLVFKHARRHCTSDSAEIEDLLQLGRIGLWRGIKGYDPSKGAAPLTYFWRAVSNPMLTRVRRERENVLSGAVSLDYEYDDGTHRGTLLDITPDSQSWAPDMQLEADEFLAEFIETVTRRLSSLPQRTQGILLRRAAGETQTAVAASLGISKARVGQLEKRANNGDSFLKKLQAVLPLLGSALTPPLTLGGREHP